MPFSYTCPHCGKETLVEDRYAGQSGPCLGCGQMITMPGTPAATPFTAPAYPARSKGMGAGGIALIIIGCMFVMLCVGGVLVALLLPAVGAAREAARRMHCTNNMKQIELALLNYESAYGQFPPAYTVDKSGKPLHSWRTLILPFMEQEALYNLLKMDEPWDSPHNLAILEKIRVPQYRCPSDPSVDGSFTNYAMVLGPNCVSDGPTPCKMEDLVNGLSHTIHVIETKAPIPWYEPRDINIDDVFNPDTGMGSYHPGIVMAAFCDASVHPISTGINPETLRAMLEGKKKSEIPPGEVGF